MVLTLAPIILITGTDTNVGKTITTAAIAAILTTAGHTVAVNKPVQTGVLSNEPGDIDEVARLAGITTVTEGARFIAAMAPIPAAANERRQLPTLEEHTDHIHTLAAHHDHVLVEGAGGLLVQLTQAGHTLADLAHSLTPTPAVIVVTRPGLGTLNHTQLTLEALANRNIATGLVIGDWPHHPDQIERSNEAHLKSLTVPYFGRIPSDAAHLPPEDFRMQARVWLRDPHTKTPTTDPAAGLIEGLTGSYNW